MPPLGPIYVVSSSPIFAGLEVTMDGNKGQIMMKPPSHVNLIQIMHFDGRYYLRNGYHRVAGALAKGVAELPALVVEATQLADVEIPALGIAGFSAQFFSVSQRPPLVSDFFGKGTVDISMRERRYGVSVSLQMSPINIGV